MSREANGTNGKRMAQRRVLIVHQSPLFREVMEQLLSRYDEISVVAVTTDREEALRFARQQAIDTLVLEAGEDAEETNLAFVSEATRDCQELRTIALNLSNTGYAVYSAKSLRNIEPQELVSLLLTDSGEGAT